VRRVEPKVKRATLQDFALGGAFLGSFLTYRSSEGKEIQYVIALGAFAFVAFLGGLSFRGARFIQRASVIYLAVSLIAMWVNVNSAETFSPQLIFYPIVFFLIGGCLWRIFLVGRYGALLVLSLFVANGAVALLGSLGFSEIPGIGSVTQGRAIFLTSLPSSGGLVWNVNYYAATQAVGFWLLFSMLKRGTLPRPARWMVYFVALSVVLGSSRSCTVALILSVLAYRFFEGGAGRRALILGGVTFFVFSFTSLYFVVLNDPDLNSGFRLYKGLNNREEVWDIGLELAAESKWFGYGSPNVVQHEMLMAGASTSTVQNSLLTMQLLFGIGGTLIFLASVGLPLLRLPSWEDRRPQDTAVFALLFFVILDSAVRSYLLGGVGPVPFSMMASIAYLIRRGKR